MLMSTNAEMQKENRKINEELVESKTPKQLPSIWYT